jgi:hypothetical protein
MINNTDRRKQWLMDWDEYAIYRERAIYRAGAFVVMVTSSGCPAPYIFETEEQAKEDFKRKVGFWLHDPKIKRWKKPEKET